MKRDDNNTLVTLLLFGVFLLLVAFAMVALGWPRTSVVSDSFGDTTEQHGSRGVVIGGLGVALLAQMFLWVSLTGYGVRAGVLAAGQVQEAEAERLAAKRDEGGSQ